MTGSTALSFPGTTPNESNAPPSTPVEAPAARGPSRRRLPGLPALKWETRFKLAVLLSFLILVTILIVKKTQRTGNDAPTMALAGRKATGPSATAPTQSKGARTRPAASRPVEVVASRPKTPEVAEPGTGPGEVVGDAETPPPATAPEPAPRPEPREPIRQAAVETPAAPEPEDETSHEIVTPAETTAAAPRPEGLPALTDPRGQESAPPVAETTPPAAVDVRENATTPAEATPAETPAELPEPRPVGEPAATMPQPPDINDAKPEAVPAAPQGPEPIAPATHPPSEPPAEQPNSEPPRTESPAPGSLRLTETPPAEPPTATEPATAPAPLRPAPAPSGRRPEAVGERLEPVTHVVRRGENFWTISRHYYGTGRFYKALWAANQDQVAAPDQLYVGMTILIPAPEDLDRSLIEAPKAPTTRAPIGRRDRDHEASRVHAPAPAETLLPVQSPTTSSRRLRPAAIDQPADDREERDPDDLPWHIVRPHETLRVIARHELGDPDRDAEIRDLNRDVLDARAQRPRPGLRLRLPADARRR